MHFVLDCSVTVAWFFRDEASPAFYDIQDKTRFGLAVVPELWRFETINVLLQAEKRNRIKAAEVNQHIELLTALPVEVDGHATPDVWRQTLSLSRDYGLTAYDASYLELAIRRGLPLATKDMILRKAAKKAGFGVLPD